MENKENALNSEELKQVSGGGFPPSAKERFVCLECKTVFEVNSGDNAVCPNCGSENCLPEAM